MGDEGLCQILKGIRKSSGIRKLECSGNVVGDMSTFELANILSKTSTEPFQELSLTNVRMGSGNLNSILEMMSNNCFLEKLVLARMPFDEISVAYLAKIARRAKKLYCFSISGGEILSSHLVNILKVISRNRLLEYIDLSWLPLGSQGEMVVSELKQEITALLYNTIIRNQQLIHLDLSYSRVTDDQVKELIEAIRKSSKILCLHLTGNGISSKGRKHLVEELQAETVKIAKSELDVDESLVKLKPDEATQKRKYEKLSKDEPLVIWRTIGHNAVFFANKWVVCDQCYICEKWRFSVFIFSKELAVNKFIPMKTLPLIEGLRKNLAGSNLQQAPYILCETYQWRPIKLFSTAELVSLIDPSGIYKITSRNICQFLESHMGGLKPCFHVSSEMLQQFPLTSNIFIAVLLLPPKKHDLYFTIPNSEEVYYDGFIVPPNETEIRAPPAPPLKKKQRLFLKERSVFRLWRDDTPGQLLKILEYDFNKSKIKKFVKSQIERNDIFAFLLKYLPHLKEEFVEQIVKSTYPNISWIDFTNYCQQRGLIDKQINLSVIDRLFIAVNVDIENTNSGDNPERALCRYEFLEILLRIAGAKYKDTGVKKTYKESLEALLGTLININEPPAIQEFRYKEIWTLPIDDLLRANLAGLRKIYNRYLIGQKRALTLQDTIQLIRKDCEIDISELDITRAYGYSKMSIVTEIENFSQYRQMTFEEFLEFIVRIANMVYSDVRDKQTTLQQKVDKLLVILLGMVHSIKYPPYVPEDSDEDEDEDNN